ncbi:hypothetical protein BW731_00615 [Vagococcus martis]|uniref:Uncharacterized protein n=2 Tax=Vagococcus martis TaxID=1768210 RepID=A0A1V4DK09_9ENTE|nr:hypothetical protein BW731_00615 [Vagococcus martis]
MSGAMIYGNSVFLTEKGELFLQELIGNSKPIRMTSKNKYNQMKILLERIEDGDRNLLRPNYRVRENDHLDLLHNMIDEDLVKGISLKYASNKPHLYFSDNIRITEEGYEIMDNEYKEKDNSSMVFNIYDGDFKGAQIGGNNVQYNNYDNVKNELDEYLAKLSKEEQEEATQIVEVINSQELNKVGKLSKFTNFLETHPKLVELTGKMLVWGMTLNNK